MCWMRGTDNLNEVTARARGTYGRRHAAKEDMGTGGCNIIEIAVSRWVVVEREVVDVVRVAVLVVSVKIGLLFDTVT